MKKSIKLITMFLVIVFVENSYVKPSILEKKIDLNLVNADHEKFKNLIEEKFKLKLDFPKDFTKSVSYTRSKVSLKRAIYDIADSLDLKTTYSKGIFKFKAKKVAAQGQDGVRSPASTSSSGKGGSAYNIPVIHLKSSLLLKSLSSIFTQAKLTDNIDGNSIHYYGDYNTYKKMKNIVVKLDQAPQQILIEAKIVEVTKNFGRSYGFSFQRLITGTLGNRGLGNVTLNSPAKLAGKGVVNYRLGTYNGGAIDAMINLAENRGDAKVISRPKIVTDDRKTAEIKNGITFNVKISTASSSGGDEEGGESAAGELREVSAGLALKVTPATTLDNKIKLSIELEKSEVDQGLSVDGIPGILSSTASTSVIVAEGSTAAIGGIIKKSKNFNDSGLPFIKNLPFIGLLFRESEQAQQDQELMIFITPKVINKAVAASL